MRILFLSTWFPYPFTQGSKLRAYYLLKGLAQSHRVALVAFEDQPVQPADLAHMRQLCERVDILPRRPFETGSVNPLLGWFSLLPATVRRMYSPQMAVLVQQVARDWQPDAVVALTFATAPYALPDILPNPGLLRVVDIDNLMYRMLFEAYQASQAPFDRLRRWLAAKKFARYERWLYQQFDISLAVTSADRQIAQQELGLLSDRLAVVPNGVDTQLNQPGLAQPQPDTLVYNGALTYQANFDAMAYFLREIYPQVLARRPQTHLKITGKTQGVALDQLPLDEHVSLTGFVEDVRPVVAGSWGCVVPLRIGGGTRLKVLEAMALGTPVVSSAKGVEGLDVTPERDFLLGSSPSEFAQQTLRLLELPDLRARLAERASQLVGQHYEWRTIGQDLAELLVDRQISTSAGSVAASSF